MLVWFVGTGSNLFVHNVGEFVFNKSIFHWKRAQ
jgi:hypothetical protein